MEHTLESLEDCPSCNGSSFSPFLSALDYTYSRDAFQLVTCNKCMLVFTNPRPPEQAISKYYDNPDYVSHTDTNKGLIFFLYSVVKRYALRKKQLFLSSLTDSKHILDYGAGSGDFSVELAQNNWSVTAYEPDQNAREKIRSKSQDISIADSLNDLQSGSKPIIVLWHVLEHVHRLSDTLTQFNRIITEQGKLVIAVPNYKSYDASFYGADWAAYDVPRHLYHFEVDSLTSLLKTHGFKLVSTQPMWFDSYYVSLLSEKNKNTPSVVNSVIGWSRAFCIGCISNLRSIGRPKNASSITYIFEKTI